MAKERFPALKHRDFRLMWIGLLISNIGTQMQFAAINWHIFILTGSAISLGLIGLSRFVPITIFSLIGGAVADTHNRKRILFITQTVLTILSFILAITTITHLVNPLIIYAITALTSVAIAFDAPPRQAIVPSLVKGKHVSSAMSLNVTIWYSGMIIGPALSGFIIKFFGVGGIYLINSVSFLAVISALLLMKTSGDIEGEPSKVSLAAIWEGLVFVKSKTIIWSTMILDFLSTFFSSATALLPIFTEKILHVGPIGFGFLYAAPAIGAVLTGFFTARSGTIKNQGKVLILSILLYGAATIIFGLSKFFILSFFALFLVGAGDSISSVIRNTIRQLETPDYIRGRMTSINMIFFMGGPQLGEFEAGILAAVIGGPLSVVVGGVGTIAAVGTMAVLVPVLRNYSGKKEN